MEALSWLAENLAGRVWVSLMGQYIPFGKADQYPEINRKVTRREYRKVQDFLFSLPLEGFVQELSSAQKDYIPSFQLEGVEAPDQGNS